MYDAVDNANPTYKGIANLPAGAENCIDARIVMTDTYAIVLCRITDKFFLAMYDISGSTPVLKGSTSMSVASYTPIDGFDANDSVAVFSTKGVLQVADLTNPASPSIVGTLSLGSESGSWPRLALCGDMVAVSGGSLEGLWAVSVANKTAPQKKYVFVSGVTKYPVSLGDKVAVLHPDSGNTANVYYYQLGASAATLLGSNTVVLPDTIAEFLVNQEKAYFPAIGKSGVSVYNVTGYSLSPAFMFSPAPITDGFSITSSHAYSVDGANGIGIYDLSAANGTSALVGQIERFAIAVSAEADGDILHTLWRTKFTLKYVAYNIENRANPVECAALDLPYATNLALMAHNGIVCVKTYDSIYIIENVGGDTPILKTANPYKPGGPIGALAFVRDGVLLGALTSSAESETGLFVLDISNPANPVCIGNAPAPTHVKSIVMEGSRAYVSGLSYLGAYELAEPGTPFQIDKRVTTYADFISVYNGWLYLAYYNGTSSYVTEIRKIKLSAGLTSGYSSTVLLTMPSTVKGFKAGFGRLFASQNNKSFGIYSYTVSN